MSARGLHMLLWCRNLINEPRCNKCADQLQVRGLSVALPRLAVGKPDLIASFKLSEASLGKFFL